MIVNDLPVGRSVDETLRLVKVHAQRLARRASALISFRYAGVQIC
jgi:alkyl hydroperoxide reductase subunit AhpC